MNVAIAPRAIKAHVFARDPFEFYTEPSWVDERLFAVEKFEGAVVDPACGSGRIVTAAQKAGLSSWGNDIVYRSDKCVDVVDFFASNAPVDNLVSNPPYANAQAFVEHALRRSRYKTAMLLPTGWKHGDKRSRWLETTPLRRILAITPRPSMPPGKLLEAGMKPGGGKVDFSWYIWHRGYDGRPEAGWLRRDA